MNTCTVILIAYYADQWLPKCLSSLQTAQEAPLHLVLADNYGNQSIKEYDLSAYQVELTLLQGPLGFAEANNRALVAAKVLQPFIVFLNQDTISATDWITRCLKCLSQNPKLGAVSPIIRNYEGTDWDPSFLDCLSATQRASLDVEELPELLLTSHVPAPALVVRRKVLEQVGPFDPIYGSYYEDYDLCERILKSGYKIGFCTSARINHFSGSSTNNEERTLKRMRQIIRNRGIYRVRHENGSRFGKVLKLFFSDFPIRLARSFLRTPSSQPTKIVLLAYYDLLQELPRLLFKTTDKKKFQQYLKSINWMKLTES